MNATGVHIAAHARKAAQHSPPARIAKQARKAAQHSPHARKTHPQTRP
jgi:hypothetical protein